MGELKPGTIFRGNVNGAMFKIVKIENHTATIKELNTGKHYTYGVAALEHCNISVMDGRVENDD